MALAGSSSVYAKVGFSVSCCQTLGLVLRLRVDFVLPLSQEQEEEQQPPTKIYQTDNQWGV